MTIHEVEAIDRELIDISKSIGVIKFKIEGKYCCISDEIEAVCVRLETIDDDIIREIGLPRTQRYAERTKAFVDYVIGCGNDCENSDIAVLTSLLDRTMNSFLNLQIECLETLDVEMEVMTDTVRKLYISKELRRINTGVDLGIILRSEWTNKLSNFLAKKQAEIILKFAAFATQPEGEQQTKPTFKVVNIQSVFDILKPYFKEDDHEELFTILKSGNNAVAPLIFLDQGNKFAYFIKQLYELGFIVGCDKITIQDWIVKNIKFMNQGKIFSYTKGYIEKCISTNDHPCKKPISLNPLDISNKK